jgi:hypothetical protein
VKPVCVYESPKENQNLALAVPLVVGADEVLDLVVELDVLVLEVLDDLVEDELDDLVEEELDDLVLEVLDDDLVELVELDVELAVPGTHCQYPIERSGERVKRERTDTVLTVIPVLANGS